MAELARGHVSDRPFARTIFAVALKRFSGELVMTEANRTYRLAWQHGYVVAAESASAQDAYGRIALAAGFVNSTQLGQALRKNAKAGEQLAPLAEAASLSDEHIVTIERLVFEASAKRVFALEDAAFVVQDRATLEAKPGVSQLDPRWLIYHGVRSHYTIPRLTRELSAVSGRPFRLTEQGSKNIPAFGLGEPEMSAIGALRESALTLDELMEAAPGAGRAVGMALVYALAVTDSIEPVASSANHPVSPAVQAAAQRVAPKAPTPQATTPQAPTPQPTRQAPTRQAPTRQAPTRQPTPPPVAEPEPAVVSSATPDAEPEVISSAPPPKQRIRVTRPPKRHSDSALHRARKASVSVSMAHGRSAESDAERNLAALKAASMIEQKLAALETGCDHFATLGVTRDTAPADVRMAYFRLAKQLHPDRLRSINLDDADKNAHRLFAHVNQAFSVLSDQTKRRKYLELLAEGGEAAVKAKQDEAEEMALKIFAAETEFQRGLMALRHNAHQAAFDAFEKATELNPEEAEHHAMLGWALWCNADDKEAVHRQVTKRFTKAITLQPKCVAAFFYRGQIAKQRKVPDTAVECFRKVLELDPSHKEAQLELRLLQKRSDDDGKKGKKGGLFDRLKRR